MYWSFYCRNTRRLVGQVSVGLVVMALLVAPAQAQLTTDPATSDTWATGSVSLTLSEAFDQPALSHDEREENASSPRTPRGALWRSIAFPGWGQFYNRDYFKIPIVYAALGGVGYFTYSTNDSYITHRRAALFRLGEEQAEADNGENEWEHFEDEWLAVRDNFGGTVSSAQVRDRRDTLRRNRDLLIILSGFTYALSVLEAYVAAQLQDFDVGEDLGFSVLPSTHGVSTQIQLRF